MKLPAPFKVEVTLEDIERGVRQDTCWCPIARAIKRTIAGPSCGPLIPDLPVRVGNHMVDIDGGCANLPEQAVTFVRDFDAGREVHPFSFEIL